jgi:excisionase family DNA binding protein
MPTLQRYKKLYQNRLPSEGKGRKQRYPEEALPVFEELRVENAGRRGRPRKNAAAPAGRGRAAAGSKRAGGRKPGRPPAAKPAAAGRRGRKPGRPGRPPAAKRARAQRSGNLLTLTQISKDTGISYPTLVRYVRLHSNRLPSEGTGRTRRFHPEAVDVFRQLRSESGRGGRKPGAARGAATGRKRAASRGGSDAGTSQRLKALEKAQQALEKRFHGFVKSLQKLVR